MSASAAALASVLAVSALPLITAAILPRDPARLARVVAALVALAVGAMLAGAFLELLPEAFAAAASPVRTGAITLAALLALFTLEKLLSERAAGRRRRRAHALPSVVVINLVGDFVHNATDGMAIAAAFLTSHPLGVATTIAVAAHELPHELGDYGILLHSGLPLRRAMLLDLLTQTGAVLGTLAVLAIAPIAAGLAPALLPVAAASFIYLAAADLIPELRARASWAQLAWVALGVLLVWLPARLGG
ncbi:MAG TPA: ZIP family metal transporter [Gemmatimonadaceae bacterium]|nr:ZIP family metal transporter [Gemmatimonadaceae bacterium]